MDVGDDESIRKGKQFVTNQLKKNSQELFAIVNNAGTRGNVMYDDFLTIEDYIDAVNVNTFGVIRVTKAFKKMIKNSRGRIVTVVSVLGRVALPGTAPYSVSKFAVMAYNDALRNELKPFGVKVLTIEPGFFRTRIVDPQAVKNSLNSVWQRTAEDVRTEYGQDFFDTYKNQLVDWLKKSSAQVSWVTHAMFHSIAAKYPRTRYVVGHDAIFKYIPSTFLPTGFQDSAISLFVNIEKGRMPLPKALIKKNPKLT